MDDLNFADLRAANRARVGQFKNSHGQPAHTQPDGSDWCPAKWLRAIMGELGELAAERIQFEMGHISPSEYAPRAAAEAADVNIYLDLFSQRALDLVDAQPFNDSSAQVMMALIAEIGAYCNVAKKRDRGDISTEEMAAHLRAMVHNVHNLLRELLMNTCVTDHRSDVVIAAHPTGIDLGAAVRAKFNSVSDRIGVEVKL